MLEFRWARHPLFMYHLQSVRVTEPLRSRWVAMAPAGMKVEWNPEIIDDIPNELIGWRSLEGSEVSNAGSVHFEPMYGGQGTQVTVVLKYDPPPDRLTMLSPNCSVKHSRRP